MAYFQDKAFNVIAFLFFSSDATIGVAPPEAITHIDAAQIGNVLILRECILYRK